MSKALEAVVVSQTSRTPNQDAVQLALFKSDGTPFVPFTTKAAHQADSVAATVGALVTDFNALLAKLQAAGLMA